MRKLKAAASAEAALKDDLYSPKALKALILPLILEQFLAVMVGVADTVMVSGIAMGNAAVAAVSTVDTINFLFIQLFSAMSAGGSVVAAQYLGKGDGKSACAAAKQLILSTALLASAVSVLCILFHRPVIGLLDKGSDPATLTLSYTYLVITALSYPFLGIYNGGVGILRAMGNSKTSLYASVIMNLINVGGNAFLIYACGMGVAGAGISTLVSRIVSAVIVVYVMYHHQHMPIHLEIYKPHAHYFRFDFSMIRRIFKVGIPNGLENSLFQVGKVLIMGIIASFPTVIRAANGVCNSVANVANIPGSAIGLAAIAIIGQLIGADRTAEAKAFGKKLMRMMYLAVLPLNLLLFFVAEPVAWLFSLDAEGVAVTAEILRTYAVFSICTWAPSFGMPNILRAAGDARFTMTVSIASMLILRLGASYLLVYGLGLSLLGVWVAMYMDWIARGLCFMYRFERGKWLEKKVI